MPEAKKPSTGKYIKNKAFEFGVLALGTFVLATGVARATNSASHKAETRNQPTLNFGDLGSLAVAQEIKPIPIKEVPELPGYGLRVTEKQREAIRLSTIQLDLTNMGQGLAAKCTGVKITINREPYIMSAGHCFTHFDPRIKPWVASPKSPNKALNFANPTNTIAIHDPIGSMYGYMAAGHEVSIPQGLDSALVRTDWIYRPSPNKGGGYLPRFFDKVRPLTYKVAFKKPLRGQQVALYSVPQAAKGFAVEQTGIYLGRTSRKLAEAIYLPKKNYDVVGINPTSPNNDPCYYGGSGSFALLANGQVLGPLSQSATLGYGPKKKIYNPNDKPLHLGILEYDLGLDIKDSQFSRFCFYSVPRRDSLSVMLRGFNNYP